MKKFEVGQKVIIEHPITGKKGNIESIKDYAINVILENGENVNCHQNIVYDIPDEARIDGAVKEFNADPLKVLSMALVEIMQLVKGLSERLSAVEDNINLK